MPNMVSISLLLYPLCEFTCLRHRSNCGPLTGMTWSIKKGQSIPHPARQPAPSKSSHVQIKCMPFSCNPPALKVPIPSFPEALPQTMWTHSMTCTTSATPNTSTTHTAQSKGCYCYKLHQEPNERTPTMTMTCVVLYPARSLWLPHHRCTRSTERHERSRSHNKAQQHAVQGWTTSHRLLANRCAGTARKVHPHYALSATNIVQGMSNITTGPVPPPGGRCRGRRFPQLWD